MTRMNRNLQGQRRRPQSGEGTVDTGVFFVELVPATELVFLYAGYVDFVLFEEGAKDVVQGHFILKF